MTTPAPATLNWTAKSLTPSAKTTEEFQRGALDLSSNKWVVHETLVLPDGTDEFVVETTLPAVLYHIHIVATQNLVMHVQDLEFPANTAVEKGHLLLRSSTDDTVGTNVKNIRVFNNSGVVATLNVFYVKGTA